MNLYSIDFGHWAPKGSEEGIKGYVLAENNEVVYYYVDKTYCYDMMEERHEESKEDWNMEWEEFTSYREKMLHCKGQLGDEDGDYWNDLYYGITLYGWTLIAEDVDVQDFTESIELNIIKVI